MTKIQAEILESIAKLPEADRQALVEHLIDAHLGERSFLDRMTPEQRAGLDEGIAQAERGEVVPAQDVYRRITQRHPKSAK